MRVAAIYDIHGNLPALEAVLGEMRGASVDEILVGGDILPGPMPCETIARLLNLDNPVQFIYGNGEIAVLDELAGRVPAVPEAVRPVIQWTSEQVGAEYAHVLRRWPKTIRMEIAGIGGVLFCHATPRDENECFTRLTEEDLLIPVLDGLGTDLVVCGHTHMQFDRTIGTTRVVNAGSVGMPFGKPGADWLLLGPGIELRHTSYDVGTAAERMRATDYPGAEQHVSQFILQPPSEEQMLAAFTHASFR